MINAGIVKEMINKNYNLKNDFHKYSKPFLYLIINKRDDPYLVIELGGEIDFPLKS